MKPNRSPNFILFSLAFGVFIAADDLTVVSTMLRQIIFDLEIPLPDGLDQATWIVNAYLIAYVVVMPFIGRVSDIVGRRAVYISSLLLFLAGSIWVPFANSFESFLFGRVLTALGGGAMVPVAMAVIADVYPAEKRATALGTLGAIDTAGWVWGPLYGALLIRFLTWRWQFYLNIPLTIIGLILAWRALADLPQPTEKKRIDWIGTAVLTLVLLCFNIALLNSGDVQSAGGFASFSNEATLSPTTTWILYSVSIIGMIAFVLIQRNLMQRAAQTAPLINLTLFQRPNFSVAVLINFLVGAILIIAMVNVPLLVNVLAVDVAQSALISGYLLSGMTGAMAVMAHVGGKMTERFSYRLPATIGLLFCISGFALLGLNWRVNTPFWQSGWQLVILGIGFGLLTAPVGTAVINAAPDDQRGIASSLVIVMRLIGMSVGLSGLTAFGLRRFNILRTQIELPDLPITDPTYQQAIVDGLVQVTVQVLTETFLVTAVVGVGALIFAFMLKKDG
ncbi:MAG: MFS transporter [Chloroflexota bacterium]